MVNHPSNRRLNATWSEKTFEPNGEPLPDSERAGGRECAFDADRTRGENIPGCGKLGIDPYGN